MTLKVGKLDKIAIDQPYQTNACPHQQLRRQVSDRITLTETNTGLASEVWVEAKRTVIAGAGARMLQTELICEMATNLSGAVWDESEWDDPSAVWGE